MVKDPSLVLTILLCVTSLPICQSAKFVYDLPDNSEFDYIIVGGGAAGCVLARTFADADLDVLLIERGDMPRSNGNSSRGLGSVLLDDSQTQTIITRQGIRTQTAAVLGGGTSIGLGSWIEEDETYFKKLVTHLQGERWSDGWRDLLDYNLSMSEHYRWLRESLTLESPHFDDNSSAPENRDLRLLLGFDGAMEKIAESWFGERRFTHLETLQPDTSWKAESLFQASGDQRHSAVRLLEGASDHLIVLLNTTVIKAHASSGSHPQHIECVTFERSNVHNNPKIIGSAVTLKSPLTLRSLLRRPSAVADLFRLATQSHPQEVCLRKIEGDNDHEELQGDGFGSIGPTMESSYNDRTKGRIYLSAGALNTPIILLKSGIGPKKLVLHDATADDDTNLVQEEDDVGRGLHDRPAINILLSLRSPKLALGSVTPKICTSVGLRTAVGTAVERSDIVPLRVDPYDKPLIPFENLAGGNAHLGILLSSRQFLPLELRSNIIGDVVTQYLKHCADDLNPADADVSIESLNPCVVLKGFLPCLANSAVWWTYLSHVHSRGSIGVDSNLGGYTVDLNYLGHPADLKQLTLNTKSILHMLVYNTDGLHRYVSTIEDTKCGLRRLDKQDAFVRSISNMINLSNVDPSAVEAASHMLDDNFFGTHSNASFATFPFSIPDLTDDKSLSQFVQKYYTSLWQLQGSVQLGRVLNAEFAFDGVSHLSVVDSSIMPFQTRMGPQATIMAIARAAGIEEIRRRRRIV